MKTRPFHLNRGREKELPSGSGDVYRMSFSPPLTLFYKKKDERTYQDSLIFLSKTCHSTLWIFRLMLFSRRLIVDSDIGKLPLFKRCSISTTDRPFTRRLNTASSSSVKLQSWRKRLHSGSVNSCFRFTFSLISGF